MSSPSAAHSCPVNRVDFAKQLSQAVGLAALSMAALFGLSFLLGAAFGHSAGSTFWGTMPLGPCFALAIVSLPFRFEPQGSPLNLAFGLVSLVSSALCLFPQALPGEFDVRMSLALVFLATAVVSVGMAWLIATREQD